MPIAAKNSRTTVGFFHRYCFIIFIFLQAGEREAKPAPAAEQTTEGKSIDSNFQNGTAMRFEGNFPMDKMNKFS